MKKSRAESEEQAALKKAMARFDTQDRPIRLGYGIGIGFWSTHLCRNGMVDHKRRPRSRARPCSFLGSTFGDIQ